MSRKKSLVVLAYHNVGYRCLEELIRQDADIALVFTHDDSPSEEIWFASVRDLAQKHGIPVMTSDVNLRENVELLRELAPDLLFSFYYRNMVRQEVLDIPRMGALNLHGSFLPKYRGRVPVNWAIINGETETGATLHYMVEKPDAGDIVDQEDAGLGPTHRIPRRYSGPCALNRSRIVQHDRRESRQIPDQSGTPGR